MARAAQDPGGFRAADQGLATATKSALTLLQQHQTPGAAHPPAGSFLLPHRDDRSSSASGPRAGVSAEARAKTAGRSPQGQPDRSQRRGNLEI